MSDPTSPPRLHFPQTRAASSLVDRLLDLKDRLLRDRRFQRFAARFPLTRPFARRYEQAAFDLCAGFVYSQALLAAVRLDILRLVSDRPIAQSELLARLPLPETRGRLLIEALIALQILSRRTQDRIGLGMLGGAIAADASISAMIEHNALLYEDLIDPVSLLDGSKKGTRVSQFWPYSATPDANLAGAYSTLMTRSQAMIAEAILDAYPFGRHRSVLDVGGGEGAFLAALAARYPGPALHLFDLPPVAARAEARLAGAGLNGRIAVTGGSFLTDPLPVGADAVTLIRIAHDLNDHEAQALFQRIRASLAPDGVLIIAEPMSGTARAERATDVYFAFYLMAMGSGRPRSAAALEELLRAAGFRRFRRIPTRRPMLASVLVAR